MQKIKIVAAFIFLATFLTIVPTAKANFTFFWPWSNITPPQVQNVTFITPTSILSLTPTVRLVTPTVRFIISTPTPTRTLPTPTRIPTAFPTITPTSQPVSSIPTNSSSSSLTSQQQYIMNAINDYRKSQGLSAIQPDSYTCNFANTRAQEISVSFNHDGFTNRVNSHTLPYPSYHQVTENIAMTSNYQDVVNMWANSAGHAANMRADTPYVCVAQYGNYFAYEGWKP